MNLTHKGVSFVVLAQSITSLFPFHFDDVVHMDLESYTSPESKQGTVCYIIQNTVTDIQVIHNVAEDPSTGVKLYSVSTSLGSVLAWSSSLTTRYLLSSQL